LFGKTTRSHFKFCILFIRLCRHRGVFRFHSTMDLYFFKVMSLTCVIIEPSHYPNYIILYGLSCSDTIFCKPNMHILEWYVVQVNNSKGWITYQQEKQYEKPGEQHFHVKAIYIFQRKHKVNHK
jgi:hypothetical protein